MTALQKSKKSLASEIRGLSLWQACGSVHLTVTGLCKELSISRQTAYDAWKNPDLFPIAAPKIFARLNIK